MKKSTLFQLGLVALAIGAAIYDLQYFLDSIVGYAVLFTPGPMIATASGSIGGQTFSHNKGGAYVRTRAIPTNPSSEAQLRQRSILQSLSSGFQDLTSGERLAWFDWAQQNPGTNALGRSFLMDGKQAYVKLNSKILLDETAAFATPPIITAPDPFTSIVQDGDIGAGATDLTFADALESGNKVELWAAVVNSAAKTYIKNLYRFIAFSPVDQASPWDNQADIESVLGTLVVGQTLHVRAAQYDPANGQSSEFLRTRVLISTSV